MSRESIPEDVEANASNSIEFDAKIAIARRVLKACIDPKKSLIKIADFYPDIKFTFYTGAPDNVVRNLKKYRNESTVKFSDLPPPPPSDCNEELHATLHEILADFYLVKRIVPNMNDIILELVKTHQIKKSNVLQVICIPLPGTQKSIIVENTDIVRKRHAYLQKINQYRLEKRCIVYLCDKFLKDLFPEIHHQNLFTALSPSHGLIFFHSVSESETFIKNIDWIISNVAPKIPENSVIVIASGKKPVVPLIPNAASIKSDMVKWLRDHNIPHNPQSHRAELYTLIQKSKHNFIDEVSDSTFETLRAYCHDVLYCPRELPKLIYPEIVFNRIRKDLSARIKARQPNITDILGELENYSLYQWKKFESELVEIEENVRKEDFEMDEIADKLVMMAKDDQIPETELSRLQDYIGGIKQLIDTNTIIFD